MIAVNLRANLAKEKIRVLASGTPYIKSEYVKPIHRICCQYLFLKCNWTLTIHNQHFLTLSIIARRLETKLYSLLLFWFRNRSFRNDYRRFI